MSARHYGLLLGVAASFSLLLAGCGGGQPAPPGTAAAKQAAAAKASSDTSDETLWTVLGLAKRPSQITGPKTGSTVSPELWEAALKTLHFAGVSAEDPETGMLVTNWYSPPGKPDERLRVTAFILSRALRTTSLALTIERQVRTDGGAWQKSTVSRETVNKLDNAILLAARHIHAERYRASNND